LIRKTDTVRHHALTRYFGFAGLFCLLVGLHGWANKAPAADAPPAWLTGEQLRRHLDDKVSITWSSRSGAPLRQALNSLGEDQRIAILLDRRVDPDQKIEFVSDDLSLDATLKRIAKRLSIGVGQVGAVIYFGPESTARRVRTLSMLRHDEAIQLPVDSVSRFLRLQSWKWPDLSTPRDLLEQLARECHIGIQGADRIPHDLWAAADLPPMNFCDRLTLVAAQFDLTFKIDPSGARVELVPMPATVEIRRDYAIHVGGAKEINALVASFKELLPGVDIRYRDGALTVRGLAEDQDFVASLLAGDKAKRAPAPESEKRYTLSVVSTEVGKLIGALGRRLHLDVQFDDAAIAAAGLSLKTEVKLSVKLVDQDQLLHAVLDPAGLTFDRRGTTILVRPKK
jgi:hypothetical protein